MITPSAPKKFRVLVSDDIDPTGIDILRSIAEVDVKTKLTEDQLCDIIGDYDALMVRSGTRVTKRVIQNATKLKIIAPAQVGVDNVDVDMATKCGIFVVNSPLGNTISAAEHAVALLFTLARKITLADASLRDGKWEREKFMGSQLQHKTLGVVGMGRIGFHVAKICREIGMDLMCYDPCVDRAKAESINCRIVELDELLKEADVVTLHVPLIPATRNLINEERLHMMKKKCLLINCSRGGVVDEAALCSALRKGVIAGAALDVFQTEGEMEKNSLLLSTPNLLLTPHIGACTHEAQVNVSVDVARKIRSILLGGLPESAVNLPGIRDADMAHLGPWIQCCEIIGRIVVQLLDQPLESIVVTVERGFEWVEKSEVFMLAAANGAIGVHKATRVNFINVRQIAEKNNIKMAVIKDESSLKGSITVEVTSSGRSARIRGMLTEDNEVLLKSFDGILVNMILPISLKQSTSYDRTDTLRIAASQKFDTKSEMSTLASSPSSSNNSPLANTPSSIAETDKVAKGLVTLLYSKHDDVPGVLASITAVLASAGVNIANCYLGREHQTALTIFQIDSEFPADVAEKVLLNKAVHVVKVLQV